MTRLTSQWVKNRWEQARMNQAFYNEKYGEDIGVKQFYKNDNPLRSKLIKYIVTLELKYQGNGYEFFIPQESFTIYTNNNSIENENYIIENTKQAISSIFKGRSQDWIYNNVEVTIRGVEKSNLKYNEIDVNQLRYNNSYISNIPTISVNKRQKGNTSVNKNNYTLDLWF